MANSSSDKQQQPLLHIVMFPWIAYGHMTPFLHLSNQLSQLGHKISFLAPKSAHPRLEKANQNPTLVRFFPLSVPHVDGLPPGAETNSDIPSSLAPQLLAAFDLTRPQLESLLILTQPDFVFFDLAHWVPSLANELHVKSVCFVVVCAAALAGAVAPYRAPEQTPWAPGDSVELPPGCPFPKVRMRPHEARRSLLVGAEKSGDGITLANRVKTCMTECDAMAMRTCTEVEGPYCDYMAQQYNQTVLMTGHLLPETDPKDFENSTWARWLQKFEPNSVVYCALGSQIALELPQFQEILLGFELTNLPFLLALQPPQGSASVEDALPDGFKERTQGRGVVCGGWVPQTGILGHESVGCFVSHCGFGSMWEGLVLSECRMVLVPHLPDQIINARLMVEELGVAVEVETEETNGWISKESLCKAIKSVMNEDSELGAQLKKNHAIWKDKLSQQKHYIHNFIKDLQKIRNHI